MEETLLQPGIAADYIRSVTGGAEFLAGIVLGSGLGDMAEKIEEKKVIPYSDIPGFLNCTADGHKGNLIAGTVSGRHVCAMQGRFHCYEGYAPGQITFPVRVMRMLGVKYLFVSNASGAVNSAFKVGDIMVITDHINMLPNPLVGPNADDFGPRFPDMLGAYDPDLTAKADEIARESGISLRKGVYLATSGPSYETQAEYDFFKRIGADAVGMSTTPEVIVARHCGMKVFGVSVISSAPHDSAADYSIDGDEVIKAAGEASVKLTTLFTRLIGSL
ncbi:MAG: purine nucleoside phosphorylase I, inosine and guanosine-specific [Bacteroidales bacterium]|nr:purine nucleoside phosphorylase I, inosine and guanosine-specific [Bacteroidales bacterium]